MSFLNFFKDSASEKGRQIADFIIALGAGEHLTELLKSTPPPMRLRLMVDYIIVGSGAVKFGFALSLTNILRGKAEYLGKIQESMYDRLVFHLQKMSNNGVNLNIQNTIVDENEKEFFEKAGWKLNTTTGIKELFEVIGDYRNDRYCKAIAEGYVEPLQQFDGSRLTAKLMQERKKSCDEDGYPYAELKLIYTTNIAAIFKLLEKLELFF